MMSTPLIPVRPLLACVVAAGCVVGLSSAGTAMSAEVSITGKPAEFIPGDDINIFVRIHETNSLNFYEVDLFLESTNGVPGVDFYMDAVRPLDADYAFGSGADPINYLSQPLVDGSRAILATSDFLDDPLGSVDIPPAPSILALVTIHTTANAGPLTIGFDFVDLGDAEGGSIPATTFGEGTIPAIPEPSAGLLALIAIAGLGVLRRTIRGRN